MNYYSTRDHQHIVSAAQAIACGLAPDGGLFVPESLPEVSAQQLQALCGMTYQQRAVTIMRPFLSEFTDAELERFTAAAYGSQSQHNGTGAQHAARDLLFHLQILKLCVKLLVMCCQTITLVGSSVFQHRRAFFFFLPSSVHNPPGLPAAGTRVAPRQKRSALRSAARTVVSSARPA